MVNTVSATICCVHDPSNLPMKPLWTVTAMRRCLLNQTASSAWASPNSITTHKMAPKVWKGLLIWYVAAHAVLTIHHHPAILPIWGQMLLRHPCISVPSVVKCVNWICFCPVTRNKKMYALSNKKSSKTKIGNGLIIFLMGTYFSINPSKN